ncbi:uncharacterized protein DEA37_0014520 [Paragonimus westermani]|uniref:Uncharacterized protein n=1 Tax=Paragonimus westermani TaxID=34504 RepID=A0A5J4P1N4_9TREM|nr:uncharacterized protein DEA37_0014520 [Paragonimus westermani]
MMRQTTVEQVLLALHLEGSILAVPVVQQEQQQQQPQQLQQPQEQQKQPLPLGDVKVEVDLKEDVVVADPKESGAQELDGDKNPAEPANENVVVQLMQEQRQGGDELHREAPPPPPAQKNEDNKPDEENPQEKQPQQQQQQPEEPVQLQQQQNEQQKPPEQQLQVQPKPNETAEHAPPPMPPSHDENVKEPVVGVMEPPIAEQDEAKRIEDKRQEAPEIHNKNDLNGILNDQQNVGEVLDDKVENYHRIVDAQILRKVELYTYWENKCDDQGGGVGSYPKTIRLKRAIEMASLLQPCVVEAPQVNW